MNNPAAPLPSRAPIHFVEKSDIAAAAASLARAFEDDPLIRFLFPRESSRTKLSNRVFKLFLGQSIARGLACASSPGMESVATWISPGEPALGLVDMIRFGALPLAFRPSLARRLLIYSDFAGRLHDHHAPGPHWYLTALGTVAERRGEGLGGALVEHVATIADEEGTACYLETNNEANVPYYERFAFEVVAEATVPGSSLGHWSMLRPLRRS